MSRGVDYTKLARNIHYPVTCSRTLRTMYYLRLNATQIEFCFVLEVRAEVVQCQRVIVMKIKFI